MRGIQQVAAKIVQRAGPCSPGNHPPFHFHPGVRQAFAAQAAIQGIQRAKLFLHQFFQHLHRLCKAVYIPHLAHRLRRPACPRQRSGLLCRQGHRLFQKDVLARFQRRHGIGKMRVVRGADDNSVTAFQQFLQCFAHTHIKGKLPCPAHSAFSGAVVNGRNRRPFFLQKGFGVPVCHRGCGSRAKKPKANYFTIFHIFLQFREFLLYFKHIRQKFQSKVQFMQTFACCVSHKISQV